MRRAPFIQTAERYPEAKEVQYCTEPGCGCPVVVANGAMEAHVMRRHATVIVLPVVATKWEREWRD